MSASPTTSPLGRLRAPSLAARPGALAAVVGVFVVVAIVLIRYALRVHTFQPDEYIYVTEGRRVAQDFGALFDTKLFAATGIARLDALAGALSNVLFSNSGALTAHKVINAAGFASAVFPVALLARGIGLRRGWLVAAAFGAVAIAWIPLATSWLTEPLTYAAFAWAAYAIWRAAVRPGWPADLLAIALVGVAVLGRANMAFLGGVLAVVVLVQELRFGRRDVGWRRALGRHWLLGGAVAAGIGWLAIRGSGAFAGNYPVDLAPALSPFLDKSGGFLRMLSQGLTALPLMLGGAWTVWHLAKPDDERRHAYALLALMLFVGLLYSLNQGVLDERLVFYLAWVPLLAATALLARRDVPALVVAPVALLVAWLTAAHTAPQDFGGYAAFAHPGEQWWSRVIVGNAGVHLPGGLAGHAAAAVVVGLAVLAVAAVAVVRGVPRAAAPVAIGLLCVQLLLGAAAGVWAMKKFVYSVGDAHGAPFSARTWIDDAHPPGPIGSAGLPADLQREFSFYNDEFSYPTPVDPGALATQVQRPSGRLDATLPPSVVLVPEAYSPVGLAGRELARAKYLPGAVIAVARPARATWLVRGPDLDGWLAKGATARIEALGGRCVAFQLTAAPDAPSVTVRLRAPDGSLGRPVSLKASGTATLRTASAGTSRLRATGFGTLPPNRRVSVQLTALRPAPCVS